uniref:ATP synthase mitochondrial F1 complex assembly factor 2 n=1 Tax=Sus scrofa TaxID=9823 RepID=A0A8D0RBU4_PIG
MWRTCLRLRDGGRRLLNRPRGGLIASEGRGPSPPTPARAYASPAERKRFYQNVSITQGEDHAVQHLPGQPDPARQGPADPGGTQVPGHRHRLLQGGRAGDAGGAAEERVGPGDRLGREEVRRGDQLLHQHPGAQHPRPDSRGTGQPPGVL